MYYVIRSYVGKIKVFFSTSKDFDIGDKVIEKDGIYEVINIKGVHEWE